MAVIHIQRIKSALHKLFDDHIDLTDYEGKPDDQREKAFLSRSLAAYCLTVLAETSPQTAGPCVTDGFNDNGIDAVLFDRENEVLYAAQSKWIEDGRGTIAQTESKKFVGGFRDLVNLRLDRFNDRLRCHAEELRSALLNTNVRIVLVVIHTGVQGLSEHVRRDFDDLVTEMNEPSELVMTEIFNQGRVYDAIAGHAHRSLINIEVMLKQWGHVQEPYPAYYGQVDALSIARWWADHGRNLLHRNIRSFKGNTDVNDALAATLRGDPTDFWYFNNGITLLCSKIAKKPIGGATRDSAVFDCEGVSIVNGAQTVGVIGTLAETLREALEPAKVLVRLISLEACPDGFDKAVARGTNTQNRIERRDFAALDPNQQRLASELLLDGKRYTYKSGDADPDQLSGCSIVEATVALACATDDVALAVQAKREIGRLWEDIDSPPYTTVFNDATTATELWRAVEIMRLVDSRLMRISSSDLPRAEMVAVHGNRLVLHRVFQDARVRAFRADTTDFEAIKSAVGTVTEDVLARLADYLDAKYANAYLGSLSKNAAKCRDVNAHLAEQSAADRRVRTVSDDTVITTREQPTLFD